MRLFKNIISSNWITAVVLLSLSLIPLVWFWGKDDILINGVDTNFPLDPKVWFLRRLFVWNPTINGGIDFSSSTAGLFFHFIQYIPYSLKLNLQQIQLISLVFWFLLIVLSAYLFSRLILKNWLSQLLFTVFYSFNIYLFNTWENVKVANLSLIVSIPVFLSLLILMKGKRINYFKAALLSVVLGLIASGTGINPAYFISLFFITFFYLLGEVLVEKNFRNIFSRLRDYFLVSVIVILVNFFWILPTANFIVIHISPENSLDKIGFTNWINSLSENTSILNIFRIQGAWDWYAFDSITGQPLYIPYAVNYFNSLPFLIYSFVLPTLALISLIVKVNNKRNLYMSFSLMLLIGVFLGVGTHLPTGWLYNLLYYHLPFFTLFRSPWYIFTPLVILSIAGLIGLLADKLLALRLKPIIRGSIFLFFTALFIGNLIYSYPLIQGKIFRPGKHDSFYVKFPSYVFETKDWLASTGEGRIINYPEDEIEKFKWGYRGIESVLGLLTDKEMLFSPLNAPDSSSAKIIKEFYSQIRKNQLSSAYLLAAKLNSEYLFEKKDQESISYELPNDVKKLKNKSVGEWNFYRFPENENLSKVFIAENSYLYTRGLMSPKALTAIGKKDIMIERNDSILQDVVELKDSGRVLIASNNQFEEMYNFINSPSRLSNRLLKRDLSKVEYKIKIPTSSKYQILLERYKLEDFGISTTNPLQIKLNGQAINLVVDKVDNSYLYFKPLEIAEGDYSIRISINNPNLLTQGSFDDISRFEAKGVGIVNQLKESDNTFLKLINKSDRDYSLSYTLDSFDPLMPYLLTTRYKQIYGNHAQILLGQTNEKTLLKTQSESFPNYPEWQDISFFYEPVKTKSRLTVNVIAPETKDPLGTSVLYDDLGIYRIFANDMLLIRKNDQTIISNPVVTYEKENPTHLVAKVENINKPHIIVFSENYSPHWVAKVLTDGGSEIKIKPLHFSANLYANAWYIEGAPSSYKLSIYYEPQKLLVIGSIISLTTPIFILILFKSLALLGFLNYARWTQKSLGRDSKISLSQHTTYVKKRNKSNE